ncbi:MAG: ABC transporter ATP-binding protein [Alphaproteobacteria bacterium]|jgi:oligopeptide/dipeptide ABC transporter ATP-binding protein|nr:ABC transporter ATP-binding protein [Rhodospirillaceae bacterium]MBT6510890.1 ABC transporter ATP-binding protein [Rhodospirillaceae bacterium]MDG2480567.1 ABC transporter ATP-binding protein [Alphaproteobacteria bacterium]
MSTTDNDPVLDIRDLSVSFNTARGSLCALRHVDITVPQNKIVGIVGESGCGKSTLINSVLRLLSPNSEVNAESEVIFQGDDVMKMDNASLQGLRGQRISMIFQDPMTALNPVISIGQQMVDVLYRQDLNKAQKRERAAEMLSQVGIPDPMRRLDDYPHQFSGGMRQRICIAMALMMNPALLIADEPTTALDVTLEAQIIHLMKELREKFECSMLFVSHNLGLIAELCDEVIVMYAGEVIEQGEVHDLFHRAQHPYTQMLLECDPARIAETRRDLPTITGSVPDLVDLPKGCIFSPRCPKRYAPCDETPPGTYDVNDVHSARCFKVRDA